MCMMSIVLRAEGRQDRGSRQGFVAKKLRLTQGSFGEDDSTESISDAGFNKEIIIDPLGYAGKQVVH